MLHIASTKAHSKIGALIDMLHKETVIIEKHKKPRAVLLSIEEYTRLEALDDYVLGLRAQESLKEGSIGTEESEKILKNFLNA